jgi:hypothetical protein
MTRYKGRVIVEGTLESNPGSFGHYAVIKDTTYTGFTGIDYYNFNGIFSKIRVRYIPAKHPVENNNSKDIPIVVEYTGTVDKVLYRS